MSCFIALTISVFSSSVNDCLRTLSRTWTKFTMAGSKLLRELWRGLHLDEFMDAILKTPFCFHGEISLKDTGEVIDKIGDARVDVTLVCLHCSCMLRSADLCYWLVIGRSLCSAKGYPHKRCVSVVLIIGFDLFLHYPTCTLGDREDHGGIVVCAAGCPIG